MYEVIQIHQCWCNQHCKVWPPSTSCPDSYVFIFALCYSSVHSTNIYYATTVCHPHMLLSPMIQIPLLLFQTTTLALGMQYIRVIRLLLLLSLFSRSDSVRPHGWQSTRGSSVPGILQARILEWVAFPSPMHACMLNRFSCVQLCVTPWTAEGGVNLPEFKSWLTLLSV